MRWFLAALLSLGVSQGFAKQVDLSSIHTAVMLDATVNAGLKWKIGDQAKHALNLGGFIQGSMDNRVSKEEDAGFWTDGNMDMGFMGKQHVETLYDRNTGKVLKMLVDGKEQKPEEQDPNDFEVISMDEAQITVKAGTFQTVHVKIRQKSKNQITEIWVNMSQLPINGMAKMIAPTQLGQMNVELVSFVKN